MSKGGRFRPPALLGLNVISENDTKIVKKS